MLFTVVNRFNLNNYCNVSLKSNHTSMRIKAMTMVICPNFLLVLVIVGL